MRTWNQIDELEIVESYAREHDFIASEEELSDRFDEGVAPYVLGEYGPYDSVAINEAFNNWTDGLCKDGWIHPVQHDSYEYVGDYAK